MQLLWPFYVAQFIESSFALIAAYLIVYFHSIGLTFFEISILMAVNFGASALFEIPTGAVADVFGRKLSVILRNIMKGVLLLLIPLTQSFVALIALFLLWGVAETLKSGADESWVLEWLKHKGREDLFSDYVAKITAIMMAGGIIGPLIAALLLGFIEMRFLWTIQGTALFLSTAVLFLAREHFSRKRFDIKGYVQAAAKNMREGIRVTWARKLIFWSMIAVTCIWFVNATLDLLWQPYLKDFGIPVEHLGYVLSGASALGAVAALLGARVAKRVSRKESFLALMVFVQMAVLVLIGLVLVPGYAIALLLGAFMIGPFRFPLEKSWFQSLIPSELRATVTSIRSSAGTIGIVAADLVAGILADNIGPQMTLALIAPLLLIPAVIFLRMASKRI